MNVLLQIEATAVKKMRLHFFNSAVIANSKMDYYGTYLGSIFFLVSYKVANGLLQTCRLVLYGFDSYVMLIQGSLSNREFKIRRLRTTTTVKHATAHDQNHVTVRFSRVVLRLR